MLSPIAARGDDNVAQRVKSETLYGGRGMVKNGGGEISSCMSGARRAPQHPCHAWDS